MGSNPPRSASMFAQAHQDFKAKQATLLPTKTPSQPTLSKQLFPSSSPGFTQDGNIENLIKNPNKSISSFKTTSLPDAQALKPRPENIPPRPPPLAAGRSMASLYNGSDSFRDVDVLDLSKDDGKSSFSQLPEGVLIEDGDIDDYDDLNLDYEEPLCLPPLPPKQTTPPKAPQNESPVAGGGAQGSQLSWSPSSPSHFVKPQPRDEAYPRPAKRESLDDASSPLPVAKKRAMPRGWRQQREDYDDYEPTAAFPPAATPPTRRLPWNTSEDSLKAQKKQLKTQHKKPPGAPEIQDEPSTNEIREAVKSHSARTAAISLSNEQRHVKSLVIDKSQSVFFTGPAGTGKSVLMRSIIDDLKKKHARDPERVAVTASTGLAACNIGGMTLHSFAGIGLGKEDAPTLVRKIRRNPRAKNRWLRTKVLIIDEISMVDGELFDKLSQIGRTIRNNGRPWGGIQLVITGDFFQLPPVPDGSKQREARFAFEAATWTTSIDHTIGLNEVFRQRDPEFAQMLNEMRLGKISDDTVRNFMKLSRPLHFEGGLEVTELFPTRNEVESSNERRLRALPGQSFRYESSDSGDVKIRDKLLQNMMAPRTLELKQGAQVMLIKNMDDTLVNGSLGTVVGFMTENTFETMGDPENAGSDTEVDPKVMKRLKAFNSHLERGRGEDQKKYPLVKFRSIDGSERSLLCVDEDWKVELPTGEVQASRKQLPLILAWALSIHKAQGQTLERVKVDLGKVFEKGQAYVALSRATTQQGLQVLRFQKNKVMAHSRVVGFYEKLYSAESAVKKKTATSITNFAYKQASGPEALSRHGAGVVDLDDEEEEAFAAHG